jgi:NADPH:quinone reductase-like Zn-dependent oxidoreductase
VRRIAGPAGVDVVLDPLGGNDWRKGYRLLRPAGRLVAYGFANLASGETRSYVNAALQLARTPVFTPLGLMDANRAVAGVNIGHLWSEMELLREEMEALVHLYRDGHVRPHVDAVFPFSDAAGAHRRMQRRQNVGKILLVP